MRVRKLVAVVAAAVISGATAQAAQAASPPVQMPEVRVAPALALELQGKAAQAPAEAILHVRPGADPVNVARAHGLHVSADFSDVDAAYVVGTVGQVRSLRTAAGVSYLEENERLGLQDSTHRFATRVEAVQSQVYGGRYRDAAGRVLTGKGIGVAVVDSGIDSTHPDLTDQVKRNFKVACATPGLVHASGEKEDQCFQIVFQEADDTDTSSGHGTHVAGIVAGNGRASEGFFKGVAPDVGLYGFGIGEAISVNTSLAASSFQWVIENHDEVTPAIKVITNSYGCIGGCDYDPEDLLVKQTNRAVDLGITVLFAAGNDGSANDPGTTDSTTGTSKNPKPGVLGVANYDDDGAGDRDNTLDTSSSRGLATDKATWPDLSAPGAAITSACRPGKPLCDTGPEPAWSPFYNTLTGTSMATPHVAGAIAVLLQADPTLTPAAIEDLLEDTAYRFAPTTNAPGAYTTDPTNPTSPSSYDKGHGLLDVQAAVEALGVEGGGNFAIAPMAIDITSPEAGATVGPITTFTGTADTSGQVMTPISGDKGDYSGAGAADIEGLAVVEEATGVRYTVAVRDIRDTGSPNTNVTLRINQQANGRDAWTSVLVGPTGTVTPTAFNATSNQAPATTTSLDEAADTVSFVVPYTAYYQGTGPVVLTNTVVTSLLGSIQDVAPGGLGASYLSNPRRAEPFGVHYAPAEVTPEVRVSIGTGDEVVATVAGTSPNFTWSADVDFAGLAPGSYKVFAKLEVEGFRRASANTTVVVPEAVDTVAPAPPAILSPTEGKLTPRSTQFFGTAEPGSVVRVYEGTRLITQGKAAANGTFKINGVPGEGLHTVFATATDAAGNLSAASAAVGFDSDASIPTATIVAPTPNQLLLPGEPVAASGTATDGRTVAGVYVQYLDATGKAVVKGDATCTGCGTPSASWTSTATLLPGTYTMKVTSYDAAGNSRLVTTTFVRT